MTKPQSSEVLDYKKLFESSPGLYLVLTVDLKIVAVSNAYLKATMTNRDNIVGKGLFEVFPDNPDDPNASGVRNLARSLQRVIENKMADDMAIQKYDIPRPASEGGGFEERFWKPVNTPMIAEDGKVEYIFHQVDDVTEMIQLQSHKSQNEKLAAALAISKTAAETNLQHFFESELKYKHLFEIAPDAVISLDSNGIIINWNFQAVRLFGWSKAEVIGKKLLDIIIPTRYQNSGKAGILNFSSADSDGESNRPIEFFALQKSGKEKEVEIKMSKSKMNDDFIVLVFIRDITERKQLLRELERNISKLKEANAELESFSYSISHDLRTPLRAIHGYTKILSSDFANDFNDEAKGFMEGVMQNARKMGQLIDDLLTFARIGRKELQHTEINMNALVESVITDLKNAEPSVVVDIQVQTLPDSKGDHALITQVFINLISNAIKFSIRKENPRIEIGAIQNEKESIYFVKDNGVGFDMQYYDKLFGVFQRLHSIREYEGTGVGLALVKRIITRHGGKIWAESKLDQGSTFYFCLVNNNS